MGSINAVQVVFSYLDPSCKVVVPEGSTTCYGVKWFRNVVFLGRNFRRQSDHFRLLTFDVASDGTNTTVRRTLVGELTTASL